MRGALLTIGLALAAAPAFGVEPLDAQLTGFAYPHPVEVHRVTVQRQDLEVAYMDVASETPNGRTVLLLHGKNFSGAYWEPTIEALTDAGYRVIAPDQIGFGKSSKPEAFQYTFHGLATVTADLLDALDVDTVSVVGHSMGGMLATRFALLHPERTERLVLLNPIGLEDWQADVPYVPVDAVREAELRKTPEGVRAYMTASYFDGVWEEAYEPLVAIQAGWSIGPDREALAWTAALTTDMVFTQPVVHDFPRLEVPTLLIVGDRDRTAIGKDRVDEATRARLGDYPRLARSARRRIPQAKLVLLDGIGHVPHYEAPGPTHAALLDFLG